MNITLGDVLVQTALFLAFSRHEMTEKTKALRRRPRGHGATIAAELRS
jgi:hypothetical protein